MSNPAADLTEAVPLTNEASPAAPVAPPSSHVPTSLADFRAGLYPELNKKPYNERIALWTLEALGFKRSEQAEAAGYLCVIPYSFGGYRSFPARWVAPGDLALLADLVEAIKADRIRKAARAAQLQSAAQERAITKKARDREAAQKKVARLMKTAPAWMDREELEKWAAKSSNATHQNSMPSPLMAYFSRHAVEIKRLGVKRQDAAQARVRVSFTLSVANEVDGAPITVPLTVETKAEKFEERLWRCQAAADFMSALHLLIQEETERTRLAYQAFIDENAAKTRYTKEMLLRYEIVAEVWGRMLKESLRRNDFARSFNEARKDFLDQSEKRILLARCNAAFPSRLDAFYPVARAMDRRLKLVIGPTNSGKTHQAIERLKAAQTGCYLGPLRLLALEIRDRLESEGTPTSLVTGELIETREGARHAACTVEMLDFEKVQEVIVIDEVQMLADAQRGAAWVQAILGAPAQEVWMLGSPEAENAVRALAEFMGDEIEVIRTERLAPLTHHKKQVPLKDLPPNSAVIAFSRQDVLDIASELKDKHQRECAVIYGALSPEVRRQQTALFREGGVDVVVATDAIAMGLNLSLKHVFFSVAHKWNGTQDVPLPRDLVWQIAGRAGRFGHHEEGFVGALDEGTLKFVHKALSKRPTPAPQVFRFGATWPVVKLISQYFKTDQLHKIMDIFSRELVLGADTRFASALEEMQWNLAYIVDRLEMDLRDKLTLSMAPVPLEKKSVPAIFHEFAKAVSRKERFGLERMQRYQAHLSGRRLEDAEQAVKVLSLYSWLHYRYPDIFTDFQGAQQQIADLNGLIVEHLKRRPTRTCVSCGKRMYRSQPFPKCEKCFQASRRRWNDWKDDYGDYY